MFSPSVSQSVHQSISQSASHGASQYLVYQSVIQLVCQPVSQLVWSLSIVCQLVGHFLAPFTWLIFVLCEKETRYFFTPWQYRSNKGKFSTWKNWLTYWTGVDCQLQVPWRLSTILLSNQYEVLVTHKIGSMRKKKDYNKSNFLLSMI